MRMSFIEVCRLPYGFSTTKVQSLQRGIETKHAKRKRYLQKTYFPRNSWYGALTGIFILILIFFFSEILRFTILTLQLFFGKLYSLY